MGRSYLYWTANDKKFEQKETIPENSNLMITIAKRLELLLNTQAALEDKPLHYEVLNGGMHHATNDMNTFPYYVVPPLVKKYDIDLVVFLRDPAFGFEYYFQSPLTSEGVPGGPL